MVNEDGISNLLMVQSKRPSRSCTAKFVMQPVNKVFGGGQVFFKSQNTVNFYQGN